MRTIAMAIALMLASDPAFACHRYSTWKFPWHQRCAVRAQPDREPRALQPTPARVVQVVQVSGPPAPVVERSRAIEALKRNPEEPPWLPVLEEQ